MTLESHLPSERLNVKRLALEKPEREAELRFDPEKEITPEQWHEMKNELEMWRQRKNWFYFRVQARHMAELFPGRMDELNLDEESWQGMKEQVVDENRDKSNWYHFVPELEDMKLLFPEKSVKEFIDDLAWSGIQKQIDSWRKSGEEAIIGYLANVKIIAPERVDSLLDDELKNKMIGYLEKSRQENKWFEFASMAASLRILFPQLHHQFTVDATTIKQLNKELYKGQQSEHIDIVHLAGIYSTLRILEADRVAVTDRGLELTIPPVPQQLLSSLTPVPEQRKF